MTRNLIAGANADGYELWLLPYGSAYARERHHWQPGEGDRECWYLNPTSAIHDQIASILTQNHAVSPDRSQSIEAVHAESLRRSPR